MENFTRGDCTKLCCAIEEGNLNEVKKCLSKGANALTSNTYHTVLHTAVRSDNEEVVKLILDKIKETQGTVRPYIDAKDTEGETLLMWTAKCNFENAAKILLEYGANIEAKNRIGMTALHWAAKYNNIEMKKLLISKGANIYEEDINGLSPLDFAREERLAQFNGLVKFSESEMFREQGKYNEALQAYQEALDILEAALGPNQPDVLMTRQNMAVVLANQGKHSEALEIYQKVFDIQKRGDVLGPDHPDTLMTRYNMAASFSALGDSNEVFSIFREFVIIEDQSHSDQPIPLTKGDSGIIQKEKLRVTSILSQEGESYISGIRLYADIAGIADISGEEKHGEFKNILDEVPKKGTESSVSSSSEENQEKQDSDEEIFELKCDELEAIKWSIRQQLKGRVRDLAFITEEDRRREIGHYFLVDPGKKEKWFELVFKKDSTAAASLKDQIDEFFRKKGNYGKTLYLGFDKNPSQNVTNHTHDKIDEFFLIKVPYDLFVIKEECENVSVHHFVLIDPDKKKLFLEQSNTNESLLKKVEKCGIVLYSGLGQDPNEIILDKILETYFCRNNGIVKDILAKLGFSSAGRSDWTPLHDAAYIGNLQAVKNLTDDGANCHVKDAVCGRKPVHIAAREGHKDIVELFLNKGINVNEADEKKWTILHYAAWSGHLKTVKLLIDKGADIHAEEGTRRKKPIHIAAERGNKNIVNLLLRSCVESLDNTERRCHHRHYAVQVVNNLANIVTDTDPFSGRRNMWKTLIWIN